MANQQNITNQKRVENTAKDVTDLNKNEVVSNGKNIFLWAVVFVILTSAIIGNYYVTDSYREFFQSNSLYSVIKGLIVFCFIAIAIFVAAFTNSGRRVVNFSKESYIEIRRVVWPTKQEARQTTIIVGVVATVVAIMLWIFDLIFMSVLTFIDSI
ncbi:MAG: preprotein translocase subunit SecE [Succinivibrionaceae bacterium]